MMKNLVSVLAMILLPVAGFAQSGTTGSLTWSLSDGMLTVSGTGAIPDYDLDTEQGFITSPWWDFREGITAIVIEEGVTDIGDYAFAGCFYLTSVSIPGSVTDIGVWAFTGCSNLTSVVIPYGVTSIEYGAFGECSSLTSVSIPNSVTSIGEDAFLGCGLTSVSIPNSVTSLGDWVFSDCDDLTDITVGWATPLSITDNTFENLPSSCTLRVPAGTKALYEAADGWKDFGTITEQEAAQDVVVEPAPPADGRGTVEVALNLPLDELFGLAFILDLPAGFVLDPEATSLAPGLQFSYQLSFAPAGGGWQFEIMPKIPLLSGGDETALQQVASIAYTLDETVAAGEYELVLRDIGLTLLASNETVHPDDIRASVTVDESAVGNESIEAPEVAYFNGILSVNTPAAEQIAVYSVSGQLLYRAQKTAGPAVFDLNGLPRGVRIVRGSSGWVRKVVK
jgi:hypothetical protein